MVDEKLSAGVGSTLPDFSAGSRIAGYRLEERVRQGGMAVVFRAVDDRLGRQVALKVMSAEVAADETFRQRFIRESRDAAAVDDPHLIPIFEAGQADGFLFIAMRYVAGGDVQSLVRRDGPLSAVRAAAIISPVASALDAAHAAGLVHRDVKPANMLLDTGPGRTDHVYLADFGISRRTQSLAGLTGTGQFLGTLDYAAPEQIQGEKADGRADQYALACTAFELLAGEPPFRREDATAVIWAQMTEPPPSLASRRSDLPAAADTVLARALAKKSGDRYGSCREFADALREALGLTPYAAGTPMMPQVSRSQPETGNPAGVSSIGHLAAAQDEQHQATRDARIPHSQSRKRDHRGVIIRPRSRARLLGAVIAGAVVVVLATLAGIHFSGDTASPRTSSLSQSSPLPAASASTLTRSPATIPDNMYTAVMISDSLGSAFWGSSGNLNSAETIAKDDCLRTASNNPNYGGDCTHGIWVRDGFIVAYTSGPYTNGNQPTAWGASDNRTYKAAALVALSECRSSGGQSCRFDSEWAPKTPIPTNAVTTGGPWSINSGGP